MGTRSQPAVPSVYKVAVSWMLQQKALVDQFASDRFSTRGRLRLCHGVASCSSQSLPSCRAKQRPTASAPASGNGRGLLEASATYLEVPLSEPRAAAVTNCFALQGGEACGPAPVRSRKLLVPLYNMDAVKLGVKQSTLECAMRIHSVHLLRNGLWRCTA
jgi:hypothetical protein